MKLHLQYGGGLRYPYVRSHGRLLVGEHVMDMYLQYGWGMTAHTHYLLSAWGGGTVVLSPRDLSDAQLRQVAAEVWQAGGEVLLDPQCYVLDADHLRLVEHGYWRAAQRLAGDPYAESDASVLLLKELAQLSEALEIRRHLLPGLLAARVDDDWLGFHERLIEEARAELPGARLATLALSSDATRDELQIETVVERAGRWDVDGYYVVCETPGQYLVDDPVWLANLAILVSGLKLRGKPVIVGYCSHQMLLLAAAGADALCSGTWLNVRAFPAEKFYTPGEEYAPRRAVWYYCPQALSEYRLPFLDVAQRMGVLEAMRPPGELGSRHADSLFAGDIPSSVEWGEQSAFRHYLTSLRSQAERASAAGFQDTLDRGRRALDDAEEQLRRLRDHGVFGEDRDFYRFLNSNRSALSLLNNARGALLRRKWPL